MRSERVPERGDAVWIDFNPQTGSEQAGRRPALVLSPRSLQWKGRSRFVVPDHPPSQGYPFEVVIPPGLNVAGVVLSDQVKSLDWRARNAEVVASLPADSIDEVLEKIGLLLARDGR